MLLGSLLFSIGLISQGNPPETLSGGFKAFISIVFLAFVFSIPAFFVFYFLFRFLLRNHIAPRRSKLVLSFCGPVALILVFAFFKLSLFDFNEESLVPEAYSTGLLIACLGCNIIAANKIENQEDEMIDIIRTNSDDTHFQKLAAELEMELKIQDGADHLFYPQLNNIDKLEHVVIGYDNDNKPIGCGTLRKYSEDTMELKRMYVKLNRRGEGIASLLLEELEALCKELGYSNCVLETGKNQPEAISFYKKNGYTSIPNFGQYEGSANSLCFKKKLR